MLNLCAGNPVRTPDGRPINRQTRAIRRLRHSLPATGKGCGQSRISSRSQRDGRGVAEAGGSQPAPLMRLKAQWPEIGRSPGIHRAVLAVALTGGFRARQGRGGQPARHLARQICWRPRGRDRRASGLG